MNPFKLFSSKKSDYFLELDETAEKAAPAPKAEAPKAEAPKAETEAPKVEAPKVETEAPKVEAPKAEAPKAKAPKPEALKPAPAPKVEAPKPAPVPAAPAIVNFAPDYLLTLTSQPGRRRPGANMASFLDMARQVGSSRGE